MRRQTNKLDKCPWKTEKEMISKATEIENPMEQWQMR